MHFALCLGDVCVEAGRDVALLPGLNAITQLSVMPLPHVDRLVDETRGARFFTKLDLAMA